MPDCDTLEPEVIGAGSGHKRIAKNWVLGRLLRDLEYKADKEMANEQGHVPPTDAEPKGQPKAAVSGAGGADPAWEALRISVFDVEVDNVQHGVPSLDWVWFSGFAIITIQLLISIIPWIIDGDWGAFMVTLLGNSLALTGSSLPQWREENGPVPSMAGLLSL